MLMLTKKWKCYQNVLISVINQSNGLIQKI